MGVLGYFCTLHETNSLRQTTPQWNSHQSKTGQGRRINRTDLPFTSEVNLGVVASRAIFLDAEIDFFLSVDARVRERGLSSVFPFDARSVIELNFSLYSGLSSFRDSVTPVRRREDTEGDGDAGVKVQID